MASVTLPLGVTRATYRLSPGDKLLGQGVDKSFLDGWFYIPPDAGNCEFGNFTVKLRTVATGVQVGAAQIAGHGWYGHDVKIDPPPSGGQQGIQIIMGASNGRLDNIRGHGLRATGFHDHLIYVRYGSKITITDVEMWDWQGGYAIHAYTSVPGEFIDELLVDRLHTHDCPDRGGAVMAWSGNRRVTFRNITTTKCVFPTHHVLSAWYNTGPVVFDRVKQDIADTYFGPGVVMTNTGVATLPDMTAPAPEPPIPPVIEPPPTVEPPEPPTTDDDRDDGLRVNLDAEMAGYLALPAKSRTVKDLATRVQRAARS